MTYPIEMRDSVELLLMLGEFKLPDSNSESLFIWEKNEIALSIISKAPNMKNVTSFEEMGLEDNIWSEFILVVYDYLN